MSDRLDMVAPVKIVVHWDTSGTNYDVLQYTGTLTSPPVDIYFKVKQYSGGSDTDFEEQTQHDYHLQNWKVNPS